MAYQALYRKYRPQTFEDFIDQDNTKKILINSIINDKISHAYLFSGPRGIGKTSMAKIFAKAINCKNFSEKNDVCGICDNCKDVDEQSVDIVEIDAASNNGVDQIRDLKNKISIVSNKLKYKVYIIDEVHMLTNSAFNALLKTLEEPPSHVVFILATTEFYEVPETIVSRCQCFSFSRITMDSLIKRLKYIASKENIDIEDSAIKEIAHYSNGGLRDAIGMLDKINSFTTEKITTDVFKRINGMISLEEISKFYNDVLEKNNQQVLEMIDKVNSQGYDFKNFIEREMLYVRDLIVDFYTKKVEIKGNISDNIDFVNVLNKILVELKSSLNPLVVVQIYILEYINKKSSNLLIKNEAIAVQKETQISSKSDSIISREMMLNDKNAPKMPLKQPKLHQNCSEIEINDENRKIRINNALATASMSLKKEMCTIWENLSNKFMDEKYGKITQLLSDLMPMVVGNEYLILTSSSKGLITNVYSNLSLAESFLKSVCNREMHIVVVLEDEFSDIKNKYIEDKKNNIIYKVQKECGTLIVDKNNLLDQAINLFGSDVVEIE